MEKNFQKTQMKKKKVIGIPGYRHEQVNFGAGINHLEFIRRFGNPRIIMPWETVADTKVDMLYLPGGLDTAPANYGEVPGFKTSNHDVFKEFFFKNRLVAYLSADIPVFGVCLGMQMLAVRFGCKLTQDLLFHKDSEKRWKEGHSVAFTEDAEFLSRYKFQKVNSHHHQAVTISKASNRITVLATADNEDHEISGDGDIIEAFQVTGKKIIGVQWHPEEFYDEFSINAMKYLLK